MVYVKQGSCESSACALRSGASGGVVGLRTRAARLWDGRRIRHPAIHHNKIAPNRGRPPSSCLGTRHHHTFESFMDVSLLLEDVLGRNVDLVTRESLSPYIGPHILREVERVAIPA